MVFNEVALGVRVLAKRHELSLEQCCRLERLLRILELQALLSHSLEPLHRRLVTRPEHDAFEEVGKRGCERPELLHEDSHRVRGS